MYKLLHIMCEDSHHYEINVFVSGIIKANMKHLLTVHVCIISNFLCNIHAIDNWLCNKCIISNTLNIHLLHIYCWNDCMFPFLHVKS